MLLPLLALATNPLTTGWLVFWDPKSLTTFEQKASQFAEVMPEWTTVNPDGTPARRVAGTKAQKDRIFAAARNAGVLVYGMASNYSDEAGFDPQRMTVFLQNPAKRKAHAQTLARIAKVDKLDGIDLDYESMVAADRDAYSVFVADLAARLHAQGQKLSVTVHPKESEPGTWDGPQSQDWSAIGTYADVVRVMCYDLHWSTSGPGAIAENAWVNRVMRFARTQMSRSKLDMGVAAYGYDWTTSPAQSLVWDDFNGRKRTTDASSSEYVAGNAWFSGAPAYRRKREYAGNLNLRGTAVWYIGSGEPSMWSP